MLALSRLEVGATGREDFSRREISEVEWYFTSVTT